MPKILVFIDNPIEILIEKGKTSIGRGIINDVFIDNESMSSRHAEIISETMPDGKNITRLIDLNSTNGIYINDSKAKEVILNDGDQFRLGAVECVFYYEH